MNINELIGALYAGELDEGLTRIQEACVARLKMVTANKLEIGAIVVAKNLRPKYICGQPARVIRVNSESVSVVFDPPIYHGSKVWRECRLPINCVTIVGKHTFATVK